MKIAVNRCFGGFSVSEAVYKELGKEWDKYGYLENEDFGISDDADYNAYRSHPKLIAAIEAVGVEKASGEHAKVRIVEVPDDVDWEIDAYAGTETVHEKHRTW